MPARRWNAMLLPAAILIASPLGAPDAQELARVATTPPGRLFHVIGTGVAEVLGKHSKLELRVLPLGTGLSWAPMMAKKEMEFAVTDAFEAYRIYRGTEEFKAATNGKGYEIRYVLSGGPLVVSLPVRKDSSIHALSDLKGKQIPGGYAAAKNFDFYTQAILANAALTYRDVQVVQVAEIARARELFIQGRVVTPGTWQPATGPVFEMDSAFGIRYLGLDPSAEAVARMTKVAPGSYVTPPGSYAGKTGVGPDTHLFALDNAIVAASHVPEQAVYQMVKALHENNEALRKFHIVLEDWAPRAFVTERVQVPYHPGAIRFYREAGLWTPAAEKRDASLRRK